MHWYHALLFTLSRTIILEPYKSFYSFLPSLYVEQSRAHAGIYDSNGRGSHRRLRGGALACLAQHASVRGVVWPVATRGLLATRLGSRGDRDSTTMV